LGAIRREDVASLVVQTVCGQLGTARSAMSDDYVKIDSAQVSSAGCGRNPTRTAVLVEEPKRRDCGLLARRALLPPAGQRAEQRIWRGQLASGLMPLMAAPGGVPFFDDLEPVRRVREDRLDYYVAEDSEPQRRPAVVFVHGGPIREDQEPGPRDWDGFIGYGTLAASHALVGVTFNHRLYSDMHYPQAAEDLAAVIERTRALEVVDPDRIALWHFSGGGPLAVDWMTRPAVWLRAIAWTYPVLAPPPDWPGDGPRFNAVAAVGERPSLPKLLVRVGSEFERLAAVQDAFVAAAKDADAALDVIDIPSAMHGFEGHGPNPAARDAVDQAMSWLITALTRW
jgi:acetyl esterase/lipase